MPTEIKTFSSFLNYYRNEKSPIGEFARLMYYQDHFIIPNSYDEGLKFLKNIKSSEVIIGDYKTCWEIFDESLKDGIFEKIDKDDEYKETNEIENILNISCPKIPNLWKLEHCPKILRIIVPEDVKSNQFEYIFIDINLPFIENEKFCFVVSEIGTYFKRELGLDFLPYLKRIHEEFGNSIYHSYIFLPPDDFRYCNRYNDDNFIDAIGACSFYFEDEWILKWIWLHPYARNLGILSSNWQNFIKLYGNFKIEKPLSHAMKNFIHKYLNQFKK